VKVLEYFIRARDATKEAVESAKKGVTDLAQRVREKLSESKKATEEAGKASKESASMAEEAMRRAKESLKDEAEQTKALTELTNRLAEAKKKLAHVRGTGAERAAAEQVRELERAVGDLEQKAVNSNQTMGLLFNALHGNIEGVARSIAQLGGSFAALSGPLAIAGAAIGIVTTLWRKSAEAAKEAVEKMREVAKENFRRGIEGLATAVRGWVEALGKANEKLERGAQLTQSLVQQRGEMRKAEIEAERERELARLSIHDEAGRKQVNDRYDARVRGVDAEVRDRGFDEREDELQQRIWNLEELHDKVKHARDSAQGQVGKLFDAVKAAGGENEAMLREQLDAARKSLEDYEAQLVTVNDQIEAARDAQDALQAERDAAVAGDRADAERRAREALDAEEQAADELQEYWDSIYEEELRERERLAQEEERERERLAQERLREELEAERQIHAQRVSDVRAELQEQTQAQGAAQSRLAAARSKVAQAWGWMRNKDSMQSWIDEQVAQREAEKRFEKDFERLQHKTFWGTNARSWRDVEIGKMSAEDEAVRQVALAKEEEQAAQKALDAIEKNTHDLAAKLDELLTMKEA